jgi:predicted porin
MKKSLLALATLGAFAGAAQAQSSVSVYGVMDGSYTAIESNQTTTAGVKTTTKNRNTVNGDGGLSTSRLGFRGVEDLGGGLSAQFVLEYDLINIGTGGTGDANSTNAQASNTGAAGATTSGNRGFGPRYSYIGLSNKALGTLRLGRQETSIHGVVAGNLAGGANNVLGSVYSGLDGVNQLLSTQTPAVRPHSVFIDNAVTFISNNMNGVTVQLQTAQNAHSATQTTPNSGVQASGGSIGYTGVKNLNVSLGYIVEGITTANTSNIKRTTSALGGNYDFGVARLFAVHTQNKVENLNLLTNKVFGDTKLTEVGVNAPVTKVINVFGSYFTGTRSTQSGSTSVVASNTAASSAADAKGFQLGTTYAFSKRTTAYGIYGTQEIKGKNEANGAKVDGTMFSLGLRHSF